MKTNKVIACRFRALRLFILVIGIAGLLSAQDPNHIPQAKNGAQRDPNAAGATIHALPVQGKVYMLVGAGGNITVQVGEDNLFVVDTGYPQRSDEVLAAIRTISNKPILFIANTSADDDHVGGNATISKAGWALPDENSVVSDLALSLPSGASIIAHLNVLNRMSSPTGKEVPTPSAAWPGFTYETADLKLYNSEPVIIHHIPAAHTDGDSIVFFRRSDVVSTGAIFDPQRFPIIDLARGGSINGTIDALNHIVDDLLISKFGEEAGTYVIPGRGRLCDRTDIVNYRDMVTIIRDRIEDLIKKGMTLEQVKAAKPALGFDTLYGDGERAPATETFIETIYRDLSKARNKQGQ